MKHLLPIALLVISFASCKSSKDLSENNPAPPPQEVEISSTADSAETSMPKGQLVVNAPDTVSHSTVAESSKDATPQTTDTEGSGSYRVQIDATMGSIFKPKYKGFNKIYFEDGSSGSKVFVGKNLSKQAAEQLRDEYRLRGFDDAFVVSMSGSGSSAGAKFEGTESNQAISENSGLVFLVQLIAYQGANPPNEVKKLSFYQVIGFNDGFKRIYSGAYSSINDARAGQEAYKKMGFKDCFVVPFEGYKNKLNNLVGEPIR